MAPKDPSRASVMRAMGLVAGDLWSVIRGRKPGSVKPTVIRRDVREHEVNTPRGPVVLRRTTIDEIQRGPAPKQ